MSYSRADYWQEAFENAMSDEGLWHLVEQMTPEQRASIGSALEGACETQSMAFYIPENPLRSENDRLQRKLRWERALVGCDECGGNGRISYNAGPWAVNTGCDKCHGAGKIHPGGEREPA